MTDSPLFNQIVDELKKSLIDDNLLIAEQAQQIVTATIHLPVRKRLR